MWTENLQIYRVHVKKVETPEIKLPKSVRSWRKQGNSRKTSTSFLLALKPLTMWVTTNRWKILQEMGIPDYVTCLLRHLRRCLYAEGQEATVRTERGIMDWFQIGKRVHQGCILLLCSFNLYAEYSMWNARLYESKTGIKIAGRNINNLRYADDTTLMATSEEELRSLLIREK